MAKEKIPIPDDLATEILFLSDRTCCKCTIRGKGVQIHHIDGNPANNILDNLAPLCFDCHNETMIKGGFARQLNASQVVKYRTDWLERVKKRRDKADELASIQTVTGTTQTHIVIEATDQEDFLDYKTNDDAELLIDYLQKILIVKNAQLIIAQTKWDTGITSTMNQGNSDMVDFYEEILIEISTFYPKGHFNNQSPKKYFSELISSKFLWHRLILEPAGAGTGGTMISTMSGGSVMHDLKHMIVDMVNSLSITYSVGKNINILKWQKDWLK